MKPPVEHVRVSSKGKEILIRVKRYTGLEQWNDICRVAFLKSLALQSPPPPLEPKLDSPIDIEWKTFAANLSEELSAITYLMAKKDGLDTRDRDAIAAYFRRHLERGISSLQNVKSLLSLTRLD